MYEPFACTASTICMDRKIQRPTPLPLENLRGTHLFPRGDLGVVPHAGRVRLTARLAGDIRCLRDEERPRDARALLVVLKTEIGRDVRVVVAVTGQRGEDDAVGEGHVANFDRLKEGWGGHGVCVMW